MSLIADAIRFLAGRCDHASTKDGQGFNATDARFGHVLADTPHEEWSEDATYHAYHMAKRYSGQLEDAGIDFGSIPEPTSRSVASRQSVSIKLKADNSKLISVTDNGFYRVEFSYDPGLVSAIKGVPTSRWNASDKYWTVAPKGAKQLTSFADINNFRRTDAAAKKLTADCELFDNEDMDNDVDGYLKLDGDIIRVFFDYDADAVSAIKGVSGRKFRDDDRRGKHWTVPVSDDDSIIRFAESFGYVVPGSVRSAIDNYHKEAQQRLQASKSDTTDFRIDGIGSDDLEPYPFQWSGAEYLVDAERAILGEVMGTGKTIQAAIFMAAIDDFPALVVCPASIKLNWKRELERWVPGISVQVLEGLDAEVFKDVDVVVANYDIIIKREYKDDDGNKRVDDRIFKQLVDRFNVVVADESHMVKNPKAKRAKALQRIAKNARYRLLMTGTAVTNRPSELISQLRIIDRLSDLGGWFSFAKNFCDAYKGRFGWDLSGAKNLDVLNRELRKTCYVRREREDVLSELPSKTRSVVLMDIDNMSEYRRAEEDLIEWLREQAYNEREFLESIAHLPSPERKRKRAEYANSKAEKARRAEVLVRINALKKLAARGKVSYAKEWIQNVLDQGEKLVLFAWHKEIVSEIAKKFDAPSITGDTPGTARQEYVDRFQEDPECNLIVLNIAAGGVGITLTAAANVAFLEQAWTPADHDQAEDRCLRIGQDRPVTAWYLLGDGTIDMSIHDLIEKKRSVVDMTNTGKESGVDKTSILANLVDGLIKKGE